MARTEPKAKARFNEKELVNAIRKAAVTRLWHLDSRVWSRKGEITRCIETTVHHLAALVNLVEEQSEGVTIAQMRESAAGSSAAWVEAGQSWTDTIALIDLIMELVSDRLEPSEPSAELWLLEAALGFLKTEVATVMLREQAEEMGRQRDDSVASRHLAGRFLANASHELRTPLTAVLGFSELLLEETYGPLTPEQRTAVSHIENSAQNLHEIINNVLDLMQFRAGRLELQYRRMAAAPVLRSIYEILVPLSQRRKLTFRQEIPDDLGSMDADEGIVRHIVYHLLEIALRATPENGEVVLRAHRDANTLAIVTYDTALHFPQDVIDKMNDAYPILENSPARGYDGWEIGLPLVRRYTDLHGGMLNIESSPDSGTTITVVLPTQRPAARATASAAGDVAAS